MSYTCRGTINIANAYVSPYRNDATMIMISQAGASQTFYLKAANEVERSRWLAALTAARSKNPTRPLIETGAPLPLSLLCLLLLLLLRAHTYEHEHEHGYTCNVRALVARSSYGYCGHSRLSFRSLTASSFGNLRHDSTAAGDELLNKCLPELLSFVRLSRYCISFSTK